jgi:hypothetical protein
VFHMTRLLLASAGICFLSLARGAVSAEPLEGWDSTKTFTITVTDAQLRNTPSWNGEGNPPLSARRAIRLLTPVKESLVHKEQDFKPWRLSSLSLKRGALRGLGRLTRGRRRIRTSIYAVSGGADGWPRAEAGRRCEELTSSVDDYAVCKRVRSLQVIGEVERCVV